MVASDGVVITRLPRGYPRQRGLTCGETNAASVVDSFGLPYRRPPRPRLRVRLVGYSFLRDLQRLLEVHGLQTRIGHAGSLDDRAKISLLQQHLRRGHPVIVAIGNGHLDRDRYAPWARLLLGHYLTVYGYDPRWRVFYVYDSYLPGSPPQPLPAGNDLRTYDELLRDWTGPLYYPLIGRHCVYLPVAGAGDDPP